MNTTATSPSVKTTNRQHACLLVKPLLALLVLATVSCASSLQPSLAAAPPAPPPSAVAKPASQTVFEIPIMKALLQKPNPAAALLFGSGFTPKTEQWVGSWVFLRTGFRVEIKQVKGKISVSTSPGAGGSGVANSTCLHVVAAAQLSCTMIGPDKQETTVAFRPGGTDPSRLDFLTLWLGGRPIDFGERRAATTADR